MAGSAASGTLRIAGMRRVPVGKRALRRQARHGRSRPGSPRPPAGAAAQPRSRGLYLGTSSYEIVDRLQAPVVLRASNDARKVTRALDDRREVPARPARAIHQSHATNGRGERRCNVRAQRALRGPLRGRARPSSLRRFSGRGQGDGGAAGTLRLRARVFNRSGKRLRTRCDSGTRTWNAAFAGDGTTTPTTGPSVPPPPNSPA